MKRAILVLLALMFCASAVYAQYPLSYSPAKADSIFRAVGATWGGSVRNYGIGWLGQKGNKVTAPGYWSAVLFSIDPKPYVTGDTDSIYIISWRVYFYRNSQLVMAAKLYQGGSIRDYFTYDSVYVRKSHTSPKGAFQLIMQQ